LMERIFARNIEDFDISTLVAGRPAWENVEARITELFDSPIREGALKETREKHGSNNELEKRLELAISGWDQMRKDVQQKLVPYADLRNRFLLAGAPVRPETIGLAKREVCAAYEPAGMIRNRYTCIDLAVELGIFEACVKEVEESDIYLC
ncbi:MAG: hypothetical protein HN368_05000, partial [Spirochaetales bacterium]|nr:hypothetical protein [Spirochaetales bacterium]